MGMTTAEAMVAADVMVWVTDCYERSLQGSLAECGRVEKQWGRLLSSGRLTLEVGEDCKATVLDETSGDAWVHDFVDWLAECAYESTQHNIADLTCLNDLSSIMKHVTKRVRVLGDRGALQ